MFTLNNRENLKDFFFFLQKYFGGVFFEKALYFSTNISLFGRVNFT